MARWLYHVLPIWQKFTVTLKLEFLSPLSACFVLCDIMNGTSRSDEYSAGSGQSQNNNDPSRRRSSTASQNATAARIRTPPSPAPATASRSPFRFTVEPPGNRDISSNGHANLSYSQSLEMTELASAPKNAAPVNRKFVMWVSRGWLVDLVSCFCWSKQVETSRCLVNWVIDWLIGLLDVICPQVDYCAVIYLWLLMILKLLNKFVNRYLRVFGHSFGGGVKGRHSGKSSAVYMGHAACGSTMDWLIDFLLSASNLARSVSQQKPDHGTPSHYLSNPSISSHNSSLKSRNHFDGESATRVSTNPQPNQNEGLQGNKLVIDWFFDPLIRWFIASLSVWIFRLTFDEFPFRDTVRL